MEKTANEFGPKHFDMQKIMTDLLSLIHKTRPDITGDECLLETCLKTIEVIGDESLQDIPETFWGRAKSCQMKSCPHWKEFVSFVQVGSLSWPLF